jgi:alginate O-acetyltransferase complex protein AlgI
MVFSSLLFVFAFLAICYGLYMIVPGIKARNMILLLFSLVFYAWGGPSFLVLLLLMTLVCYLGGLLIGRYQSRRKLWLVMTLVVCLGLLGYYKYTGFFLTNVQAIFGVPEVIPAITLPIGISFYTFQLLSYVIDVYRKEVPAQKNYLTLLLYAALFHQCIAGPIIRYSDVNEEIMERRIVRSDVAKGITRFASGLAKKALLANGCAAIVADLVEAPADFAGTPVEYLSTVSGAGILLAALCYMLEIYLDFSAYSDMAIGMGLMIGFHYRENFNYPYIADSVTDFWRRWHISLSSFFRDYVYIPLGGNRVAVWRNILNLFAVWFLTGLWHGASWNFVLWGLYYFLFLIFEKFVLRLSKNSHGLARVLRTAVTLIIVCFGWMIFYYTDLSMLGTAIAGIFCGNGNPFVDMAVKTKFLGNIFFLIVAILACTPIVPAIGRFFEKKRAAGQSPALVAVYDAATAILPVGLLFLSLLSLVGDSFNPFLYFQF